MGKRASSVKFSWGKVKCASDAINYGICNGCGKGYSNTKHFINTGDEIVCENCASRKKPEEWDGEF